MYDPSDAPELLVMLVVNCRLVAHAIFAAVPLLVAVADGAGVDVAPELGVGVGVTEGLEPIPLAAK